MKRNLNEIEDLINKKNKERMKRSMSNFIINEKQRNDEYEKSIIEYRIMDNSHSIESVELLNKFPAEIIIKFVNGFDIETLKKLCFLNKTIYQKIIPYIYNNFKCWKYVISERLKSCLGRYIQEKISNSLYKNIIWNILKGEDAILMGTYKRMNYEFYENFTIIINCQHVIKILQGRYILYDYIGDVSEKYLCDEAMKNNSNMSKFEKRNMMEDTTKNNLFQSQSLIRCSKSFTLNGKGHLSILFLKGNERESFEESVKREVNNYESFLFDGENIYLIPYYLENEKLEIWNEYFSY